MRDWDEDEEIDNEVDDEILLPVIEDAEQLPEPRKLIEEEPTDPARLRVWRAQEEEREAAAHEIYRSPQRGRYDPDA